MMVTVLLVNLTTTTMDYQTILTMMMTTMASLIFWKEFSYLLPN